MKRNTLGIIFAYMVVLFWGKSYSLTLQHLPFGGIFDQGDTQAKTGFRYAVNQYNSKHSKSFKLSTFLKVIDVKDSYTLKTSICSHMSEGVFMIFGARPSESANIVESYSQTFHVPYVSPSSADSVSVSSNSSFQLHMKPSHTKALVALIMQYQWRNFHYVYDSEEGLYRIQEMMRMFEQTKYSTPTIRIRRIEEAENAHEDLRALDRCDGGRDDQTHNSTDKFVVLDLATEAAYYHVMRQIREVGMNKEGYSYILGTIDFLNLEMDRYRHGGVNITGFQLVNYTSPYVQQFLDTWSSLDPNGWPGAGRYYIHIFTSPCRPGVEGNECADKLVEEGGCGGGHANVAISYEEFSSDIKSVSKEVFTKKDNNGMRKAHTKDRLVMICKCSKVDQDAAGRWDSCTFWKLCLQLIDAALSVDAITVIQKTLYGLISRQRNIFKTTFRRGKVYNHNRTEGVPCDSDPPVPWMHGKALMRGMKQLKFVGITGKVEFDEHGFRKNYKFDIYNVGLNQGPFKIGDWSSDLGIGFARETFKDPEGKNVTDQVYVVTTIKDSPFVMLKETKDGKPLVGNDRFEGYCVDLAKEVADVVKFEYKLELVKDAKYGESLNPNKTEWNGMIGELIRGDADIAIAPLSITSDRERVVDFSKPFMNVGISIMIKKPEKKKPGVFSFMQPFTLGLWMCIVFGYFSVGLGIFFVSRLSSTEWRSYRYKPKMTYNKFTLPNSLWFAMGSMMLQGSDDTCPRSSPGRIIGGAWWFAVLITISSYTANLAAFLTIEKLLTPIESADDLVNQNEIAYGTLNSGSTKDFFMNSRVSTYKAMWNFMESTKPSVMVDKLNEGISRVRASKGKYAFLLESVYNDYFNNRKPCNTMKVGVNLNSNHYGIATRKYSKLRDDITLAVLSLTEAGTLGQLKKKWWIERGECGFDTGHRESKKRSLSLSNVAGAYFILIGGLVFSIIVGVCEFIYIKSKPERLQTQEGECMLHGADTLDTLPDINGTDRHGAFQKLHMPASPVNGAARHSNHVAS